MKRNYAIDVARGISLFFVILGHLVVDSTTIFNWIFSFHMPIFFILSGMCFNSEKYNSFLEFVKEKFKKRIIPYIAFTIFAIFMCFIIPSWKAIIGSKNALIVLEEIFYYGQPEALRMGAIWFLVALFFSEIILFLLNKFFKHFNLNKYLKFIIYIILALIGNQILNILNLVNIERLPFKIDTAITASVFMGIGYELNKINIFEKIKKYKVIGAIILLVVGYITSYLNGYVNICNCSYGNIFLYYISALCGGIAIYLIAQKLEKSEYLQFYGKNSLFMFAIHFYLILYFTLIINILFNQSLTPMVNMPVYIAIILSIIIYLLLEPLTIIYNKIIKKVKTI